MKANRATPRVASSTRSARTWDALKRRDEYLSSEDDEVVAPGRAMMENFDFEKDAAERKTWYETENRNMAHFLEDANYVKHRLGKWDASYYYEQFLLQELGADTSIVYSLSTLLRQDEVDDLLCKSLNEGPPPRPGQRWNGPARRTIAGIDYSQLVELKGFIWYLDQKLEKARRQALAGLSVEEMRTEVLAPMRSRQLSAHFNRWERLYNNPLPPSGLGKKRKRSSSVDR